jgi:hypothetical protein
MSAPQIIDNQPAISNPNRARPVAEASGSTLASKARKKA